MNVRRLLLAGFVAGLIYNASGMALAGIILGEELAVAFERLDAAPPGIGSALLHVATRFAAGFLTVWLYVLARDRLRPGPATAAAVGFVVWFLTYVPYLETLHLLAVLSGGSTVVAGLWGVVEVEAAALTGAWLYQAPDAG